MGLIWIFLIPLALATGIWAVPRLVRGASPEAPEAEGAAIVVAILLLHVGENEDALTRGVRGGKGVQWTHGNRPHSLAPTKPGLVE